MDLYDILYLDVPRFESLASQMMKGLVASAIEHGSDFREQSSANLDKKQQILQKAGTGKARTSEIKILDYQFLQFVDALASDMVIVKNEDMSQTKSMCEDALRSGRLVKVAGPFFYDDFGRVPAHMKMMYDQTAFEAINKQEQWEENKKNTAVKKQMDDNTKTRERFKKMADAMTEIINNISGSLVECGVVLGDLNGDHIFARSTLERAYLRKSARLLIDRYSTRTLAQFTIIGTVGRIGWMPAMHLSEVEQKQEAGEDTPLQGTLWASQRAVSKWKEDTLFPEMAKQTAYLVPLAVFRTIPIADPAGTQVPLPNV